MLTQPIRRRSPQSPPQRGGANDNVPRRSGANDNNRRRNPAQRVYINPRRFARFGRIILKAHPYGRLLSNAIDIYDILSGIQAGGWTTAGGWTQTGTCSIPNPLFNGQMVRMSAGGFPCGTAANNQANACYPAGGTGSVGSAYTLGTEGNPFSGLGSNIRCVTVGQQGGIIPNRARVVATFSRPSTGSVSPHPEYKQSKNPVLQIPTPVGSWVFTADPALVNPALLPAFAPPVPWSLNPIWTAPNREVSNGVNDRPYNVVDNNWSVSVDIVPNGQPASPSSPPKTHTLAPPSKSSGSGTKESKVKFSAPMVAALKIGSSVTEGLDLLESLYDALPSEYRPKWKDTQYEKLNVTPQEKAKALYDNFDKVNVTDALMNIITNEIEDRFFGKLGQMGGTRSKELGLNYGSGINSLTRSVSKSFYDAEQASKNKVDGEN